MGLQDRNGSQEALAAIADQSYAPCQDDEKQAKPLSPMDAL